DRDAARAGGGLNPAGGRNGAYLVGSGVEVREEVVTAAVGRGALLPGIEGAVAVGVQVHRPAGQAAVPPALEAVAVDVLEDLAAERDRRGLELVGAAVGVGDGPGPGVGRGRVVHPGVPLHVRRRLAGRPV